MPTLVNTTLQKKLHKSSFLLVGVIGIIAILTLAGWVTNMVHHSGSWIASAIMYPLTAVYFLLISSAFFLISLSQKKFLIAGYVVMGIVVVAVAYKLVTAFFQLRSLVDVLGYESNLDILFYTHIPPTVSIGFVIASLALLCKHIFRNHSKVLANAMTVLLFLWCVVIVLHKIIWPQTQYLIMFSAKVTASAIICFILFAFAVLFFNAKEGIAGVFTSSFAGGFTTRVLIPTSIVITSFLGLIVLSGYQNGQYSAEHGFIYYILSVAIIFVAFYIYNAFLLEKREILKDKAEYALREREEQIRVVFEGVPEGIVLLDDDGRVYSWNREASVIFGWTGEEIKGKILLDRIIPPDYHALCKQNEIDFLQNKNRFLVNKSIDLPAINKDGQVLDISLRLSFITINNRQFLVWFIHDISIRKSLERQLQTFNQSLEKEVKGKTKDLVDIFERVTDGFAALDKDCKFTYVNARACEMFKTQSADLLGKCVWDIFPEAVNSATYHALLNALDTQKHTQSVDLYERLGLWQEYNLYPSADGVSVFVKDITAQKKKEKEMAETRALADKLINSLPGVFYFYDLNGKFIKWNKKLEEVTGYSSDEIAVMTPLQLFPDDTKESITACTETVLQKGSNDIEADFLNKAGKRIPFYFKKVRFEYNGTSCMLGTGIDITERKKSSEKLEQSYKEIRALTEYLHKVREEERMRISREIHDELGQLLTILKINISWIKKRLPEDNMMAKEKIDETLEIADQTISSVRRIASELRPALLDNLGLHAAIQWHIKEFANRTGIQTEAILPETELVLSDEKKTGLYRILQESLTNVARHSQAEKVWVNMLYENSQLILTIADNGIGFDASKRSLKTLGLLGMKERTMGMGGKYSIESIPGKGTTVKVLLPVDVLN